jgi:spore germination cell wall hydrolase CwlJ-like protein
MDFFFRIRVILLALCITVILPSAAFAATHTVSRGESLYQISSWYGTTVSTVKAANGLKDNAIYPGQKLYIPDNSRKSSSTVSRGMGNISRSDIDLLARIIHSEAEGEQYKAKVAVGAVILNRVSSPIFPNTIAGVIYQVTDGHYQFEPVLNGRINYPANADSVKAAQDALNGWDPTNGALYFFNNDVTNRYLWAKKISIVLGKLVFSF